MDYRELAEEFLQKVFLLKRISSQKEIHKSVHGETYVLQFILYKKGAVLPGEISEKMGISSSRITATLNKLDDKGLITRTIDMKDRRRVLVELTPEGRRQAQEFMDKNITTVITVLKELGEKDAKEYVRLLGKLTEISKTVCQSEN